MLALERSRMRSTNRERAVKAVAQRRRRGLPTADRAHDQGRSERAQEGRRPHPAPGEVVDSVEPHLPLQGARVAARGELPQEVIRPLPSPARRRGAAASRQLSERSSLCLQDPCPSRHAVSIAARCTVEAKAQT